jgi:hypothetical protein
VDGEAVSGQYRPCLRSEGTLRGQTTDGTPLDDPPDQNPGASSGFAGRMPPCIQYWAESTSVVSGWTWVANRQAGVSPSDHSRREPRDHWCLGSPDLLLSAHTAAPACGTTLPSVPAMDRKPNRSNQEASTARSRELPALVWPSASPKRLGHRGPRAVKRFAMSLLRLVGCIRHPNHGAQATGRTYADTLNERRGRSCSPSYPPHLHRARS